MPSAPRRPISAIALPDLWPDAARRGITRENFDRFTAGLTPDLHIMDLLDAQPEFTKAPWDYLDLLVSDDRIARGREVLAQYAPTFAAVERAYGVDRYIVAAIWGVESNYGTLGGTRPVIRSTATLACVGRRRDYFREEFLSALEILQRGDVPADHLIGSWAGAFGPTQFMPTSFKRYAVDFDGDGHRDVVDSIPDMIASTANNLKMDGWVSGQTWGYEVVVPQNFDYLMADRSRQLTMRQWEGIGIKRAGGSAFPRPDDRAYLLLPAGARGPAFLMLQNFRVIMKYNPAEAYALAIGYLADRMRGGAPFVQALAARRARAYARRALRDAAAFGAARLRYRRAGRAVRSAHPYRHPQFPGLDRADSGWFRLQRRARPPAPALTVFKLTLFARHFLGHICDQRELFPARCSNIAGRWLGLI